MSAKTVQYIYGKVQGSNIRQMSLKGEPGHVVEEEYAATKTLVIMVYTECNDINDGCRLLSLSIGSLFH